MDIDRTLQQFFHRLRSLRGAAARVFRRRSRWQAMACLTLACTLPGVPTNAAEDTLVLIVNPESGVQRMTKEELIQIFMGAYNRLPSGQVALPLDLAEPIEVKRRFYAALVQKDLAQVNSYWARLVLTGGRSPPRQVQDTAQVLDIVANNKGAVGYVERAKVDGRVKVVYEMGQ